MFAFLNIIRKILPTDSPPPLPIPPPDSRIGVFSSLLENASALFLLCGIRFIKVINGIDNFTISILYWSLSKQKPLLLNDIFNEV